MSKELFAPRFIVTGGHIFDQEQQEFLVPESLLRRLYVDWCIEARFHDADLSNEVEALLDDCAGFAAV